MNFPHSTTFPRSREGAKKALSPYLNTIGECLYVGFYRWKQASQVAPDLFAPLSARTRSCFVYDHICHEVVRRFSGWEGVNLSAKRGFLLLNIRDILLVRFKKLDRRGRVRYVPTQQSTMYFMQEQLPGLPPGVLRLNAGYQLNELQTEIENTLITYQVGLDVAWAFPILQTTVEITSFNASGVPNGSDNRPDVYKKPRVRPKNLYRKAKAEGDDTL